VDLTATCDVFVKIDEGKKQLRFEAKGARILAGDDEGEEGRMVQVMGPNGTFVPQPLPANFSKSIQQSDMQLNFVTFVDWKEKGEAMWDVKETQIDMKTEVKVGMTFPPPLSFLPGFMLRQAGGLILKAASAAVKIQQSPSPFPTRYLNDVDSSPSSGTQRTSRACTHMAPSQGWHPCTRDETMLW
jgi:hypothetical protein